MTKEEVLKECVVEGLVVKLPNITLDRKLYMEVAKSLEIIGGKWKSGKTKGFVFNTDPSELLEKISSYEGNLKKDFQFFATPDDLADELVQLAGPINNTDVILEPSAGQGAIIKAIYRANDTCTVDYYELMDINCTIINNTVIDVRRSSHMGHDFLATSDFIKYDKIIANPPFKNNLDVIHIMKMYELLKHNGRLVSIASNHWKTCNNKKEKEFRTWLNEVGYTEVKVEAGRFKDSGTMISSVILIIDKK